MEKKKKEKTGANHRKKKTENEIQFNAKMDRYLKKFSFKHSNIQNETNNKKNEN